MLDFMAGTDMSFALCPALRIPNTLDAVPALARFKGLTELVIDPVSYVKTWIQSSPLLKWYHLATNIPWGQLRRLCVHDTCEIQRMRPFSLPLPSLRSLSLRPDSDPEHTQLRAYHVDCSYVRTAEAVSPRTTQFGIDFTCLPKLADLELEGLCNHVPVENFVAPTLRALRMHAPHSQASTLGPRSQRSSSDLAKIAVIASKLTHLELDLGNIENLWHNTAIPGVDVDMDIYNLFATLARLKSLQTLRLFPSYISRAMGAALLGHVHTRWPRSLGIQQPTTDPDAVAMFQRLRSQIPSLRELSILPSAYLFCCDVRQLEPAEHARNTTPEGLHGMAWHITTCGDKTVLTTTQAGHSYSQRQIWVGERRLTTTTKQRRYYTLCSGELGGRLDGDPAWSFD